MDRRRRNRLCIRLILLGLINFLLYAVGYAMIGGDARNGGLRESGQYYVRGHHFHQIGGQEENVAKGVWIYSYIHSITIWPSIAVMLLSMLVLARPHIIATYRDGVFKGETLWTVLATIIVLVTSCLTLFFLVDFVRLLLA